MASSRRLSWLLSWAVVPALLAAEVPARADPTPQQKELARNLMQKGHDARNAHDLKLALESFKSADDIMHVPTTGFEVARSQLDLGRLVEAHETLLGVMRWPEKSGEPRAFRDARGYAKILDDEVVPRIPQLRIRLQAAPPDQRAIVTVDGVTLPEGALLVPYRVDPGHHVVTAKVEAAPVMEGRAEADVAERQTKDVIISLAPTALAPPAPASALPAAPAPGAEPIPASGAESPAREDGTRRGLGPVAWAGFGIAAAGLAVGTVTGIMTIADKGSIASQCNGTRCPPSTYDSLSTANTLATTSTVSFVVAAAGAGVGVVAWLLGHGSAPPTASSARVMPVIGVTTVGLRGAF
jgi:hypothetical protein